jgi:para-nitrobenzyl esterase
VRDAQHFGPVCPQIASPAGFLVGSARQDEDCLSLNVWTPEGGTGGRPVLVWIHGGAFRSGGTATPFYAGDALARRGGVVVVTLQYRVGALGFLAHPELRDAETGLAGNWGLLDQLAALAWVREHAAAFGGDPDNVTLFGESAGAASVALLLVCPRARGLFQRAIVQSGAHWALDAESAARCAEKLADLARARSVSALRELPPEELLRAQAALEQASPAELEGMVMRPVSDGALLPHSPADAARSGAAARVPTLIGTNRDEWKLWGSWRFEIDAERLRRRLERIFPGSDATALSGGYRRAREARGEPAAPADLWFAIMSDRVFRVPATRLAADLAAHEPRTRLYLFTWGSPAMRGWLGACHGVEIGFVFGTHAHPAVRKFCGDGPEAAALAALLMDAWTAFARCGDPGTEALGPWPSYDACERQTLVVGRDHAVERDPRGEERRLLDACLPS